MMSITVNCAECLGRVKRVPNFATCRTGLIGAVLLAMGAVAANAQTGVYTVSGSTASQSNQTYAATAADQSAVYVKSSGSLTLTNCTMTKSGDSSSVDNSSQYGINAGVLAGSAGKVTIIGGSVTTNASGGNGLFATGSGSSVSMSNGTISASGGGAHGVDATYTGTILLTNVNVTTTGSNSTALATDFGGGTVTVNGGTTVTTATASGSHSAGIYSTGVITVNNASVTSKGDSGGVIDGGNTIILNNTTLTGALQGFKLHNTTPSTTSATVTITGGSVAGQGGDGFYVTGTSGNAAKAAITLKGGATLSSSTGNVLNVDKSSTASFTANGETLTGNIVTDGTSTATVTLQNGSTLVGSMNSAKLAVDATSAWNVSSSSVLTGLTNAGTITFVAPTGDASSSSSYKTLTTAGSVGSAATLVINTYVNADSSPTDLLAISGGSATGATTLKINNTGGGGALTSGNGIKVVSVTGGGTTASTAFSLSGGSFLAGAYQYRLYRGGTSSSDTGNANNWFLRSTAVTLSWVERALRIAAGLDSATSTDLAELNVGTSGSSTNVLDLDDAIVLARSASGL